VLETWDLAQDLRQFSPALLSEHEMNQGPAPLPFSRQDELFPVTVSDTRLPEKVTMTGFGHTTDPWFPPDNQC
jgi:hypothetical protein